MTILTYQVVYKQFLRAEEAYLGFTDKDPLSNSASHMTLRSTWPGHDASEIAIEFDGQEVILQSKQLFLKYHMPYEFDQTRGNAKFVKDKQQLLLNLPRAQSN